MNIADLTPVAMLILVAIIAISIGSTVLQQIRGTQTVDNGDYNVTTSGLGAFATFANFFSVIVIVAVAAIIIGLVYMFGASASRPGV